MLGAFLSNKHIVGAKKLWSSVTFILLLALASVAPASAVCAPGQQSCSSSYSVGEAFFGNGGNLDQSSASYRAKTALGETVAGNSAESYDTLIKAASPVGYWRLGETSGTTATDASGNSRNGTYAGGYTQGKPSLTGDRNPATAFDGVSGSNVSMAANNAWKITTTNQLAVEFWYAGTQVGATSPATGATGLVSANSGSANKQFVVGLDQNGHVVVNSVQSGGAYNTVTGTTVVNDAKPHYIEANFNATANTMEIYVDGTLDNSGSVPSIGSFGSTALNIGENLRTGASSGTIDEVAIYSSTLTTTQIAQHYASVNYQTQAGFNSNRNEYLEFSVGTSSINFGTLSTSTAKTGTATFSVKAYVANGYQVVNASNPPAYGGHSLTTASTPAASAIGTEQFGMNVVANTSPSTFGANPSQIPSSSYSYGLAGDGRNNTPTTARYDQVNKYMYRNGDAIAYSRSSSGETDYTISYIINISNVTPAGIYTMNHVLVSTATF
jgi:hypothetical protein